MGIGSVHVRSWQVAYRGHFPQAYLDGLDAAQRGESWRGFFEQGFPGERQALFVVELDRGLVGFASVGPSRDEDADGAGEVTALYLLPDQWGQGLGRKLMAAAVGSLANFGFDQATLWVLETNERARRFYEAGGWVFDGASKTDARRGFSIAEVRYRRSLP